MLELEPPLPAVQELLLASAAQERPPTSPQEQPLGLQAQPLASLQVKPLVFEWEPPSAQQSPPKVQE